MGIAGTGPLVVWVDVMDISRTSRQPSGSLSWCHQAKPTDTCAVLPCRPFTHRCWWPVLVFSLPPSLRGITPISAGGGRAFFYTSTWQEKTWKCNCLFLRVKLKYGAVSVSVRYSVRTSRIWKAQLLRKGSHMSEHRVQTAEPRKQNSFSGEWVTGPHLFTPPPLPLHPPPYSPW